MTANIILLAVVGFCIILALKKIVSERKKGKNSCGCSGCSGACPACLDTVDKLKDKNHPDLKLQNKAEGYPVNKKA